MAARDPVGPFAIAVAFGHFSAALYETRDFMIM
jgi:hypothetical protein